MIAAKRWLRRDGTLDESGEKGNSKDNRVDEDFKMPPSKAAAKLTQEQLVLLQVLLWQEASCWCFVQLHCPSAGKVARALLAVTGSGK